ncbi:MAG TPA: hypothetical protein DIT40_14050 [Alphaproteobacteria bacterium]|nr:hypothetical protein [Alphaproteobacteria bacterium]
MPKKRHESNYCWPFSAAKPEISHRFSTRTRQFIPPCAPDPPRIAWPIAYMLGGKRKFTIYLLTEQAGDLQAITARPHMPQRTDRPD